MKGKSHLVWLTDEVRWGHRTYPSQSWSVHSTWSFSHLTLPLLNRLLIDRDHAWLMFYSLSLPMSETLLIFMKWGNWERENIKRLICVWTKLSRLGQSQTESNSALASSEKYIVHLKKRAIIHSESSTSMCWIRKRRSLITSLKKKNCLPW